MAQVIHGDLNHGDPGPSAESIAASEKEEGIIRVNDIQYIPLATAIEKYKCPVPEPPAACPTVHIMPPPKLITQSPLAEVIVAGAFALAVVAVCAFVIGKIVGQRSQ